MTELDVNWMLFILWTIFCCLCFIFHEIRKIRKKMCDDAGAEQK
jgi:hypothetical protein